MPNDALSLLRSKLLRSVEQAERDCTELILEAVRTRSQAGIELAGEATVRIREIADWLGTGNRTPETKTVPKTRSGKPRKARQTGKGDYPRFHISQNELVKTGWSKKSKKEYVHKVQLDIYTQILEVVSRCAAQSAERIPAEDIVKAASNLSPSIPGYQVYLVLAFLRDRAILDKEGRRGFTALHDVREAGAEAWRKTANGL